MMKARALAAPFQVYLSQQKRRRKTWSVPQSPGKGKRRRRALCRELRPIEQVVNRSNSANVGKLVPEQGFKSRFGPSEARTKPGVAGNKPSKGQKSKWRAVDTGEAQFMEKPEDLPYAVQVQRHAVRGESRLVFEFN